MTKNDSSQKDKIFYKSLVLRSVYYVVDQFQSPLAVARERIAEISTQSYTTQSYYDKSKIT